MFYVIYSDDVDDKVDDGRVMQSYHQLKSIQTWIFMHIF